MGAGLNDVAAVLFDFDGTLVHLNIDFARMRAAVEAILPHYGLTGDGKEALYTLELIDEAARTLFEQQGATAADDFRRQAQRAIESIELEAAGAAHAHPGAAELLERLHERGVRVAIVTRNCRAAVERILARESLAHDALLTRDDVDAVKPDPAHLLAALRQLDVPPERALMVGDHPLDVRAGRAARMRTVAVLTGYSPAERFAPEQPDLLLSEVRELEGYLNHEFHEHDTNYTKV